jgi:hypothetical protein
MENEVLSEVAFQPDDKPTNKVTAASTAAGALGAILVAITSFVGPALEESLSGYVGPNMLALITAAVGALIGYFGLKYGSQMAAYNVTDRPNIPMVPATRSNMEMLSREKTDSPIEEDAP